MLKESVLDKNLIQAYGVTNFHVATIPAFILNVNKKSIELQALFKKYKVSTAAYITAWNPYSKSLSVQENAERNLKLYDDIVSQGYISFDGLGQDPLGKWPGENSFLILGLNLESAKSLGITYKQNAIIWCDIDALPKLILLR